MRWFEREEDMIACIAHWDSIEAGESNGKEENKWKYEG